MLSTKISELEHCSLLILSPLEEEAPAPKVIGYQRFFRHFKIYPVSHVGAWLAKKGIMLPDTQPMLEMHRSVSPHTPASPYFDISQAASYLHVSRHSIRKWLSTGKLNRYKVGARTLVSIVDLDALVIPAKGESEVA